MLERRPIEAALGGIGDRPRRAAVRRHAGRPRLRGLAGAGCRRRRRACSRQAVLARSDRRAPRQRLDREARGALPLYFEGAARRARRRLAYSLPPVSLAGHRAARSGCWSAAGAARAERTRACASCGESRRSSSSPSSTGASPGCSSGRSSRRGAGAGGDQPSAAPYVAGGAASAFPSVTPVCAGAIATGRLQDGHHIAGMNWYSRERAPLRRVRLELRRVAALRDRPPADRHRLQHEHRAPLRADVDTVFESLDDAGVRTAGTTYLIYRGRHRHEVSRDSALIAGRRPRSGAAR